jgi:hypothetical protein
MVWTKFRGSRRGFDDVATVLQSEVMGDVVHKTVDVSADYDVKTKPFYRQVGAARVILCYREVVCKAAGLNFKWLSYCCVFLAKVSRAQLSNILMLLPPGGGGSTYC